MLVRQRGLGRPTQRGQDHPEAAPDIGLAFRQPNGDFDARERGRRIAQLIERHGRKMQRRAPRGFQRQRRVIFGQGAGQIALAMQRFTGLMVSVGVGLFESGAQGHPPPKPFLSLGSRPGVARGGVNFPLRRLASNLL